ncbi:hypothetical protein E5673_01375 [Sphingomonas sp. PAMC26645]|uniref:hypothetical protein n=1 Tax=Sphingomonas sp. PAMC26645 TaxID=2565555 RepID=UPI00109E173C|nr:hypothetical protein [Sphingomonas sp. PAMC26645]QCB41043.1 hypothetical protein E5673_01375 [Sphingomonas sp. PAMC26645]
MAYLDTTARIRRTIIADLDLLPAENYKKTLAAGVDAFDIGDSFCSDETGEMRRYERIAAAPGYADLGDRAAPANKNMVEANRIAAAASAEALSRDLEVARQDALTSTSALAKLTNDALISISQRAGALGAGTNATQAVNYAALTKLLNTPGVSPIVLDRAYYDIGPNSLRVSVKKTEVWGAPGGTTITCSVLKLLEFLSIEDLHFYDINWVSTYESLADEATYALVCGIHRAIRNMTMNRCTFSIAKANANALKFVADIDGEYVEQVKFNDCHILAAGRMGAELSVHPNTLTIPGTNQKYPNDAVARIDTFEWNGGSIKNTGLISPLYGMAFSGTGWMNRIRVATRLDNNMTCGVEGVGICNSYISVQITNMRDVANSLTPSAAISLTANAELDRSRKMTGNIVENCIADDGTCREVRFWYQQGLQTRGNRFKLSAGSTGRGYVTYAGSTLCKSSNDAYDCDGAYTLQVRSEAAHGGASAFNEWEGLSLSHARSTSPFQLTNFYGADTTGNSINGILYTPSTLYPSQPLSAGQAEATITGSITGTTLTVTAWSGIPLRVGQKLFGNVIDALTEIKALDGTGTGGLGTYTVSKSQNAGSDTIKVGLAQKNFIRGSIRSTYGFDFMTNTYTIGDFSVDATLLDSVPHMLASRNLTIRTSGSLTAVRSIIFPEGGPAQRITNSTTGGFAIILKNKTAGSTVTIPNGATVNVASTSAGFVIIP